MIQDRALTIREGPWSFDKNLVLLNEMYGTLQTHQINFTHAPFWICLYNLLIMTRNEYIGRLVGGFVGEVIEVDLI